MEPPHLQPIFGPSFEEVNFIEIVDPKRIHRNEVLELVPMDSPSAQVNRGS